MSDPIPLAAFASRYEHRGRYLIARVSFEGRSLSVASTMANAGVLAGGLVFASSVRSVLAEANLARFSALVPDADVVQLDKEDPLGTGSALAGALTQAHAAGWLGDAVFDITTFRREELLMLLAILRGLGLTPTVSGEVVYVGAGAMGKPLSGAVKGFRSVMGYAGAMVPRSPTLLVVLLGFELQRAQSIIENYEPDQILLGVGGPKTSVSAELHATNKGFFDQLRVRYAALTETFEFSATDATAAALELQTAIGDAAGRNVILAPLNTKLSTLGAGLYALKNPSVQICYASVESYNESEYSSAGSGVYVSPLGELL